MRAQEFVRESVDADQVLQYVKRAHAPEEFDIEYSITDHPRWELKNIPVSQLKLDPEGEAQDPYRRVNWVDYDKVQELMPRIDSVLKTMPIVVDSQGWIIDGNHRATAAAEAGLKTVPAYVPATTNEDKGGSQSKKIKFNTQQGKNKFTTTMTVDNAPVGVYQYDANTGHSIAEIYTEYKGQGLGKLLVLNAIYTAAKLGMDFVEDESRTAEYDNVLDSLSSNGYVVDDNGYWYITSQGEQFLNAALTQGVNENFAHGKQNIAEAFDQPYKLKWEKGEHGDYDALATLDDGTYLSIMFNLSDQIEDRWMVEFYRNNSQALTGEGDAQRVFATVLTAVGQFIRKKKPQSLFFSAVKEDDPTGSRTRLYDRLVQRYASNLGYTLQKQEYPEQMAYKLTQNQMQENFADGKKPGRKGLSRRVGIPKKATLGQLEKIAKSSSGERRRMAQWQLNMRRGRKK